MSDTPLTVLVCGARGFVGKAICAGLTRSGHSVLKGVRRARADDEVDIDFARDLTIEAWLPRLRRVDVVINAVGIIVESPGQTFDAVHRQAPCALFAACREAGVKRVLQVSALGADSGETAYFTSKRAADAFLRALPIDWQILRPALIYGAQGKSAGFFRRLASLPLPLLPAGGRQSLQPVHIDDLVDAVGKLIDPETPADQCVDFVGPRALEYREMLRIYRAAMGLPPTLAISLPAPWMRLAAACGRWIPGSLLTPDTWQMLQAGNTGNAAPGAALLGHPCRPVEAFIAGNEAAALRSEALAAWRRPLLRAALALVWIVTGVVSLLVFPLADSLALLARVGLTGNAALVALDAAALLDLTLGVATLLIPGRRLWLFQMATIAVYSAIIAVALPEYLAHPFGPITKNLPILAILVLLFSEEAEP